MTSDNIWYLLATETFCRPYGMVLNHTDLIKIKYYTVNASGSHIKASYVCDMMIKNVKFGHIMHMNT